MSQVVKQLVPGDHRKTSVLGRDSSFMINVTENFIINSKRLSKALLVSLTDVKLITKYASTRK